LLGRIRGFFEVRGVTEVQTPLLGRCTVTDPDVEGIAVPEYGYLQTSPEYFMKRLLAAGVGDCYQLGPAFRHDEQGRLHNPEFTMLEWYRIGFGAEQLMDEVAQLCDTVLGQAEYARRSYASLVDDLDAPRDELDLAFAEGCAAIRGRCFVVDYPAEQAALARVDPHNGDVATRFELVIDGVEIANGYWELTDLQEHRQRFDRDLQERRRRGLPLHDVDELFLAALARGLPDCAGVALGVDRLVMLALGFDSIDDVLTFRA
jgi:lysyl-tRNA synthetase class 2